MPTDLAFSPAPPIVPAPLIARPPSWVGDLLGDAAPVVRARGGVTISAAASFAQFNTSIDNAAGMSAEQLRARVADAYVAIGEAISSRRQYPIRFWNFVPNPGAEMAPGLDRYMVFNTGRYDAYARWYGTRRAFNHAPATASAVGVQGADLSIFCLAARTPGTPVENPRQTPSWRYSTRYGPKPPCFARATVVSYARERRLLIGGTASIVGEDSTHVGDPAGQVEETVANLRALIAAARAATGTARCTDAHRRPWTGNGPVSPAPREHPGSDSDDIGRLSEARVYIARAQDAALVRSLVVARCPGITRLEITLSQICRPELLVEIEGIAAL